MRGSGSAPVAAGCSSTVPVPDAAGGAACKIAAIARRFAATIIGREKNQSTSAERCGKVRLHTATWKTNPSNFNVLRYLINVYFCVGFSDADHARAAELFRA